MGLLAMTAGPRTAMRGADVASNSGIEVIYGDVRDGARVACAEGCSVASSLCGPSNVRPLPPVMLDDRRGYVFQDHMGHWFVWQGGIGQFIARHPEARVCWVNLEGANGNRFKPATATVAERFLRVAQFETTVDDARLAGIRRGCIVCEGTHTTMRRSGAVGYMFNNAFVDAGCIWAREHTANLQYLAWRGLVGKRLVPEIQYAGPKLEREFWAAHRAKT